MYIVIASNKNNIVTAVTVKANNLIEAAQKYQKTFPDDTILSCFLNTSVTAEL